MFCANNFSELDKVLVSIHDTISIYDVKIVYLNGDFTTETTEPNWELIDFIESYCREALGRYTTLTLRFDYELLNEKETFTNLRFEVTKTNYKKKKIL